MERQMKSIMQGVLAAGLMLASVGAAGAASPGGEAGNPQAVNPLMT